MATVAGIGIAGIGLGAGCSAKHDPAGGVLLSIDTNLKVPDDIDTIGISVSRATDGGVESEDDLFPLAPGGMAKFPATLTLLRGTGEPLQIRAVGYKDGAAIAMRQVVTTLPADRVAVLPLELNWLDKPLVTGTTTESVRSVTSSCGALEAPVAGTCSSFTLDSDSLAPYAATAIVPSDSAAAVDCDTCFAGGQVVTVDKTSCTFSPPAGVADATAINVVFQLAAGHTAGWCNGSSCIIPLPHDAAEGWSLGSDGLIHLPPAACTSAAVGSVIVAPATASCPVLSSEHPAKQDYGTDAGAPPDSSDATVPDSGAPEAGPPATPTAFTALPEVVSIASDGTTLYVLQRTDDAGAQMLLTRLPVDFAEGATSAVTTLGGPVPPAGAKLASSVGNGFYAYGGVATASYRAVVDTYPLAAVGLNVSASSLEDAGAYVDVDITPYPGFDALVTFVGPQGLMGTTLQGADGGGTSFGPVTYPAGASIVASAHYTPDDGGAAFFVFGDTAGNISTASTFASTTTPYGVVPTGTPYAFAYAGGSVVMSDTSGNLHQVGHTSAFVTLAPVAPGAFTANENILVWVGEPTGLLAYALPTAGVFAETGILSVLPDGGMPTHVSEVLFAGDQLVWFDAHGIYRTLASALPRSSAP